MKILILILLYLFHHYSEGNEQESWCTARQLLVRNYQEARLFFRLTKYKESKNSLIKGLSDIETSPLSNQEASFIKNTSKKVSLVLIKLLKIVPEDSHFIIEFLFKSYEFIIIKIEKKELEDQPLYIFTWSFQNFMKKLENHDIIPLGPEDYIKLILLWSTQETAKLINLSAEKFKYACLIKDLNTLENYLISNKITPQTLKVIYLKMKSIIQNEENKCE